MTTPREDGTSLQKKLAALAASTEFPAEREAAERALEKLKKVAPKAAPVFSLSVARDDERVWPYELALRLGGVFGVEIVGTAASFGVVDDPSGRGWMFARTFRDLREKLAKKSDAYREGFVESLGNMMSREDAERVVGKIDALKFLSTKL